MPTNKTQSKLLKLIIPFILAAGFYLLPLEGINDSAKRVGAIFIIAAFYWVLEVVPIYTTSLLIMFLELILLSNKSISFLRPDQGEAFLTVGQIYATFSSPVIILFLGGLFLARAAIKYQLDTYLANLILKPVGNNPSLIMGAIMFVTAVFSMFMSNTATTAMMLAIIIPIITALPKDDKLSISFALSVPLSANIGGIGTPIGTPPNAVVLAALEKQGLAISFSKWMTIGVPYVIIMLIICWILLTLLFKSTTKHIDFKIDGKLLNSTDAKITYLVFGVTVGLWITSSLHKIPSSVIAFLPILVFSLTGIMDKKELRNISWDILWLISGGLALGMAMQKTGFDKWILSLIPFSTFAPALIIVGAACVAIIMSTFISNTATANLLTPITISLLYLFPNSSIILPVVLAISCSMAMALPISTPPNALAFGTGFIEMQDLLKSGAIISVIGIMILILFTYIWQGLNIL